MTEVIRGPKWPARNLSRNTGTDSVHNNQTATDLGFRGGPVRADGHMNQFVPVVLEIFGPDWFRHGHLSLDFKSATLEMEEVQVLAYPLAHGSRQVDIWMQRDAETVVCKGTAGIGDTSQSALRTKEIHTCDPSALRICRNLKVGMDLGTYETALSTEDQFERYDSGSISDPIKSYREPELFERVIACPSTYLELLWRAPTVDGLGPHLPEKFVGLFGAIEICNVNGPLFLDRTYTVTSTLIAVGESQKTENIWHEARAFDASGNEVASLRMLQRILKASSDLYNDEQTTARR
ncbi:MAG: hypothetical protein VW831_14820 [Gammaproteobacteria bacterium]